MILKITGKQKKIRLESDTAIQRCQHSLNACSFPTLNLSQWILLPIWLKYKIIFFLENGRSWALIYKERAFTSFCMQIKTSVSLQQASAWTGKRVTFTGCALQKAEELSELLFWITESEHHTLKAESPLVLPR